jgi:integrase
VKRPTESLRLAELIEIYAAKPGIQSEQVARYRRFWKEFAKIVGIETIRELSHEHVEKYEAKINDGDLAPKSIKHRYSGIRTVIAYALKRGKGIEDCRKALDVLAMLEAGNTVSLDPNPISPADFWAIHGAAEKAGDKVFAALMLFALNAAMYSSEVGAVRWDEIKLGPAEFATRRNKSKVPRVACLWPETVKAVKALPRDRETIFNTRIQAYNRFSVHRMWEKYRDDAKLPNVTFAMIRDAAFTIGCRISSDAARVLSGHRFSGAVDSYVLRQPQFVRDVCDAIRKEFFAGRPK